MFIVSIIIILVVISFVKSINASKKAREVHDIEFDKQLKEFYADYKNAAIVETVANEATEMDGYWIRLLRLKRGFEIRVSEFLISVSECYVVEPKEEVYVNFLQLGRNPLTSIQQECFATAIYHTLNTVPWLSVSKPKPSLAKDPKTERYNHFYSVRISTKENCTIPETFGAESQSLKLTMTPPPELIASSSNVTNNCNEIEKNEIRKLLTKYEELMIEQEDNFDSFSSFKYNLYFEVLVRCHIYFYNPNHNNYVKSLNHAEQIENHIKNSLSNADTKDKILACDDISREFMRINIHIYNEELRKIDQEQVSVYQKLIPTEINQMDADSEEYLNRISILSACYWLSKKYCYIRSNLLSTQTDKIGSKEEK